MINNDIFSSSQLDRVFASRNLITRVGGERKTCQAESITPLLPVLRLIISDRPWCCRSSTPLHPFIRSILPVHFAGSEERPNLEQPLFTTQYFQNISLQSQREQTKWPLSQ